MSRLPLTLLALLTPLAATTACSDDGGGSQNAEEVITTVTLTFTPTGGGAAITASVDDPDGDGGNPPVADPIALVAGTSYATRVQFLNRLEEPAEDITEEVADESDAHQVFFTGTAVNGPASNTSGAALTHDYADSDANGLPIGLANTFNAEAGTGTLTVTLRHLPPVNGEPVKTADLAESVRSGGLSALPGDSDASVSFSVSVP